MNWNEIKEKYPKCYGLLLNFLKGFEITAINEWQFHPITKMRFLYDFFDEQGIHIRINYNRTYPDHEKDEDFYNWEIELEGAHSIKAPKIFDTYSDRAKRYARYKTRIKAEEQAFLKAFEILEAKLTGGN